MIDRKGIDEIADEAKTRAQLARNRGLHTGKTAAGWKARRRERDDGSADWLESAVGAVAAFNVTDRREQHNYERFCHFNDTNLDGRAMNSGLCFGSREPTDAPAWLAAAMLTVALENIDQRTRQCQHAAALEREMVTVPF